MEKNSILMGGITELEQIKEKLIQQSELAKGISDRKLTSQRLEKETVAEEKYVVDTIESTIKQTRGDLENGYDKQISENNRKLKTLQMKRETAKDKAVAKRIKKEVKEIKAENKALHKEVKKTFKENKIPKFCDATWFYSLFVTTEKKEFITFAITTVLLLAIVPNGICFFVDVFWVFRVLLYIGIILVIVVIYVLIFKGTKAGDRTIFVEMRPLRDTIKKNKKSIRPTKKFIKEDPDVSTYGLEDMDEEIATLENDILNLQEDKEKSLTEFDNVTSVNIKDDITNASKDKIANLKKENVDTLKELKTLEADYKKVSTYITSNYEVYLGNRFMYVEQIQRMINLIQEEKASVIAEAMGIVKGQS